MSSTSLVSRTESSHSRPQRNAGPPTKYSPDTGKARPKPYVLNRDKALSSKEGALDRPYTPNVTLKEGCLVISFQAMVYEAFKQHVGDLESKEGYSIAMPKAANQLTADGQADSNSLQININGRKAYTMNFYHTTSKVTVSGQKMKNSFVEEDFQFILNSIAGAGITNRLIYQLSAEAREAIGRAKKLPSTTRLEIEGSTPGTQSDTTQQSGTKPNPPANYIPMPQHSSPPIVCPPPATTCPSSQASQSVPTSTTPASAVTIASAPISTLACSTVSTNTISSVSVNPIAITPEIRPNVSSTITVSTVSTAARANSVPTLVVRLPGNTIPGGMIPPGVAAPPRLLSRGSTPLLQSRPTTSSPSTSTTSGTAGETAATSSATGASSASVAGAKARAELHLLEKTKKQLKEKQRELDDLASQAARSKALALDLEGKLKEAQESLRIRERLDKTRQDIPDSGRYSRRGAGIDGNWRERRNDASNTRHPGQQSSYRQSSYTTDRHPHRQEYVNHHDRSDLADHSYRSRYSSDGRHNRSQYRDRSYCHDSRVHRDEHHRGPRDCCCCSHRHSCCGERNMESRMAHM